MPIRLVLLLAAAALADPAHALSLPATPLPDHAGGFMRVHEGHTGAQAIGKVNSVDPARHSVNISHTPIRSLGWPSMTMDFVVDPSVDLSVLSPGEQVNFTLVRAKDGNYEIHAIRPAGGR